MSSRKGDRLERELVNMLDDVGFGVLRAPSSGSATKRELPDVLAGNGEIYLAIEAKASGRNRIYLEEEEVENLLSFAERFGARPRVGVRFDREDWFFFNPVNLYQTDSGNYRIKKEKALNDGADFYELIGISQQAELTD